jgi:ribosomal protein L14
LKWTYQLGLDGAVLAQEGHGGSLRLAALVRDDPYFGGDGSSVRFEDEVVVLVRDQNPVERRS